ncbi:MAG: imidazoleglycerol-phosphate dehydratase HisB [Deltaproteobacteria bacterium]|nr:imidazoleglycerol-phosphate dehydratase HisB [Deltaproteobacteria bacterium]
MVRRATVRRETRETAIEVTVDLDGTGRCDIETPIAFLSHMVEQLGRHGGLDLTVRARGDVEIDGHHTTEDLAIVIGRAIADALGDKRGIRRYGEATLPMDEALCQVALDLSGRTYFVQRLSLPKAKLGTFDVELAEVFFEGFARGAQCNLHVRKIEGENLHHIVECSFKCLARALRDAVRVEGTELPSTKGTLTE